MTSTETRTQRYERYLSLLVGLAAIIAAMVSLYQASLAREQARASAWPYLVGGLSLTEGRPFTYQLANRGIGPAKIRTVRVTVDSKPVATWTDAIRLLSGTPSTGYNYSYVGPGIVMSPGANDTLLAIPPGQQAFTVWNEAKKRLSVMICYCSVYEECWTTREDAVEAAPVKNCPPLAGTEFTQ
jgi:hypothetical protein